ncbi:hypothetical protein ACJX0J_002634 (mitochondrion) [Zea mays]
MNLKQNFGQMTVSGCKEDKRWIGLASLSTQSMGMPILGKQDRETVLQFMLGVAAIYNRKFIDWQAQVSKQDTGISIWFRNMHEYLAKQKAKHVWYNLEGYCWLAFKRQKKVVSSIFLGALLTHSMWAGDNREWKNNELRRNRSCFLKVFFNGNKKMDAAPFFQGIRIIRKIFTFLLGFLCLRFAAIFFNLLNNRATSGAVNGFTEYKEELIFHLETSISVGSNLLDADYPSLDQIQFNKEQENATALALSRIASNFILKSVNLGFLHPLVL